MVMVIIKEVIDMEVIVKILEVRFETKEEMLIAIILEVLR